MDRSLYRDLFNMLAITWGPENRAIYYAQGPRRTIGYNYPEERKQELRNEGFNNTDIKIHDFMVRVFGEGFLLMDDYYGSLSEVLQRLHK